jgi:hypothetical protein
VQLRRASRRASLRAVCGESDCRQQAGWENNPTNHVGHPEFHDKPLMRDAALAIVGITNRYIEAIYHHADAADQTLQ